EEERDEARDAREDALMQRLLTERRADRLDLLALELHGQGSGVEDGREVLRALLGEAPADRPAATGDGFVDDRRRDDLGVEDDRELLADELTGDVREDVRPRRRQVEVDDPLRTDVARGRLLEGARGLRDLVAGDLDRAEVVLG